MSEDLESLRAEVAELRAELARQREGAISRRRLLTGLAGLGAAGAAGVATARPAAAADGDPLLLGHEHSSESPTTIEWGNPTEYPDGESVDGVLMLGGGGDTGMWARSTSTAIDAAGGVYGITAFGHGYGVVGHSDHFAGVHGRGSDVSIGVAGTAEDGAGLFGESTNGPSLQLAPTEAEGPPAVAFEGAGALSVDSNGDFWLCVAGGGAPTWTRLLREDTAAGRVVPITPVRVLDSRVAGGRPTDSPVVPGQKKGPLLGGQAVTLDLAGIGDIPASATGVVGNLTIVVPDYAGHLSAGPSGSTTNTSSLNFTAKAIVCNAFTSALGDDGLTIRASGTTSNRYELVVDITAYIS